MCVYRDIHMHTHTHRHTRGREERRMRRGVGRETDNTSGTKEV